MSSPVSHGMLGLAMVLGAVLPRGRPAQWWPALRRHGAFLLVTLLLAMSPDLDLIPGVLTGSLNRYHQGLSHTLVFCLLFSGVVFAGWRAFHPSAGLCVFLFFFLAAGSHLLLDTLTVDTRVPYGIMAFWPFSPAPVQAPVALFPAPSKKDVAALFSLHNVRVMAVEFLALVPIVLAVLLYKLRPPRKEN